MFQGKRRSQISSELSLRETLFTQDQFKTKLLLNQTWIYCFNLTSKNVLLSLENRILVIFLVKNMTSWMWIITVLTFCNCVWFCGLAVRPNLWVQPWWGCMCRPTRTCKSTTNIYLSIYFNLYAFKQNKQVDGCPIIKVFLQDDP